VCILLDQNLSPKLIKKLNDTIPGLENVYDHGLVGASDPFIFDGAWRSGFAALLSAGRDFVHLAERLGPASEGDPRRASTPSSSDSRFLDSKHAVLLLNLQWECAPHWIALLGKPTA